MPNANGISQNEGVWYIEAEADLSAGAAVTATRGTNIVCVKTGTGTYTFTVKGTSALKVYEVLNRFADLGGAPAGAFWGKVTGITQTAGTDDVVISVSTLNNAGTPVAADVSAVCVLSIGVAIRVVRMGNPF